jgi:hypothetical protein
MDHHRWNEDSCGERAAHYLGGVVFKGTEAVPSVSTWE